ncbi:hypothetical protein [Spiroplasma citri]|uniref:hypothetical protein n=1 Tax=Spiroplasma citri TaxID=2133 RepID=UPI0013A0A8CE|nr:hypothetical protein [Spiroplasma citri]QIA67972.1 hypothetical protein GMI18_10490 [Spiroplasma citri]
MTNIPIYYYLSHKGNTFVGREHKKAIKINCYEMPHQDILIKWLVAQTDIEHYQTERELKIENGNLKEIPHLLIETINNKKCLNRMWTHPQSKNTI